MKSESGVVFKMKTLMAELIENGIPKRRESKSLISGTSEEFIEALVFLCNKLDAEVPLWTHKEEKMLQKKNEVLIPVDSAGNTLLRLRIE